MFDFLDKSSKSHVSGQKTSKHKSQPGEKREIRARNERKTKKRRKSKACYQCRKSHKACSFLRPCARCKEKGLSCTSDSDEDTLDEELPSLIKHLRREHNDGKSLEEAFQKQVKKLNTMAGRISDSSPEATFSHSLDNAAHEPSKEAPPPEFFDFFDSFPNSSQQATSQMPLMAAGFPPQPTGSFPQSNSLNFPLNVAFPNSGLQPPDFTPTESFSERNASMLSKPMKQQGMGFSLQPSLNPLSQSPMDRLHDVRQSNSVQDLLKSVGVQDQENKDTVRIGTHQMVELVEKVKVLSHELSLSRNNPFTQNFVSSTPVSMLSFQSDSSDCDHSPHPVLIACNPAFLKLLNSTKVEVSSKPLSKYCAFGQHYDDACINSLSSSVGRLFSRKARSGIRKVVIFKKAYRESFLMHLGIMYAKYETISSLDDEFTLNDVLHGKTETFSGGIVKDISRAQVVRWLSRWNSALSALH